MHFARLYPLRVHEHTCSIAHHQRAFLDVTALLRSTLYASLEGHGQMGSCAHAGLRLLPLNLSGAYMPSYYSALYPTQTTVFTAMATIVGVCGILASFM